MLLIETMTSFAHFGIRLICDLVLSLKGEYL